MARLRAALHFYETKYPEGDAKGLISCNVSMKPEKVVEQLKVYIC